METPVQITFQGVEHSAADRELIEEKAAWLERFHGGIMGCRVVVEMPHRHHRGGNEYLVRIDLTLPGAELVINRVPEPGTGDKALRPAINHAFEAARRQLEEYTRRRRHEVKSHGSTPHARVTRLFPDEGYGFLTTPDQREVYFHRNAVVNGGFAELRVGSEVTFVEVAGEKGPQASTVRLAGASALSHGPRHS